MQPIEHPIVFGAPYSVYVRTVRLALEEKTVQYELVPVDIFASEGHPPNTRHDIRSARSLPTSMPDFACTKRARSPGMWTRHFAVLGSNRKIPVPARG
jgi:hypothetical protein